MGAFFRELGESHAVVVLVFFPFFVNFSSAITEEAGSICRLPSQTIIGLNILRYNRFWDW